MKHLFTYLPSKGIVLRMSLPLDELTVGHVQRSASEFMSYLEVADSIIIYGTIDVEL